MNILNNKNTGYYSTILIVSVVLFSIGVSGAVSGECCCEKSCSDVTNPDNQCVEASSCGPWSQPYLCTDEFGSDCSGGGGQIPDCWTCSDEYYDDWINDGTCDSYCGETDDSSSECYSPACGNQKPTANFSWSPTNPKTGDTVTFNGCDSTDSDGDVVEYEWELDENAWDTTPELTTSQCNDPNAKYTYNSPGTYTVTLTVTDNDGARDSLYKDITVEPKANKPPTIDKLTANPTSGKAPLDVHFEVTASDDDGYISNYQWDLNGDGTRDREGSSKTKVDYTYQNPGTYDAKVKVTDDDGATASANKTITVEKAAKKCKDLALDKVIRDVTCKKVDNKGKLKFTVDLSNCDGDSWDNAEVYIEGSWEGNLNPINNKKTLTKNNILSPGSKTIKVILKKNTQKIHTWEKPASCSANSCVSKGVWKETVDCGPSCPSGWRRVYATLPSTCSKNDVCCQKFCENVGIIKGKKYNCFNIQKCSALYGGSNCRGPTPYKCQSGGKCCFGDKKKPVCPDAPKPKKPSITITKFSCDGQTCPAQVKKKVGDKLSCEAKVKWQTGAQYSLEEVTSEFCDTTKGNCFDGCVKGHWKCIWGRCSCDKKKITDKSKNETTFVVKGKIDKNDPPGFQFKSKAKMKYDGKEKADESDSCKINVKKQPTTTTTTKPGPTTTTTQPGPTTTTTQPGPTTTTTQPIPPFEIECEDCEAGMTCECEITKGQCNNGLWILRGSALKYPKVENIPPEKYSYTPDNQGEVKALAVCFEPKPPRVDKTTVMVKKRFISCPKSCSVGQECKCQIRDCDSGFFIARETGGDPLPDNIFEPFTNCKPCTKKFVPQGEGRVSITAICTSPSKSAGPIPVNITAGPGPTTTTTIKPGPTTTTTIGPTTTTTVGPTTTTTTTGPYPLDLSCGKCIAGESCNCSVNDECESGRWFVTNEENEPLEEMIVKNIPPREIQFDAKEKGEVKVKSVCIEPSPGTQASQILEVKRKLMYCPEICKVGEDCECSIWNCDEGTFTASNKEGSPLNESVYRDVTNCNPCNVSLETAESGKIKASTLCTSPTPIKDSDQTIKIKEEIPTTTTTTTTVPTEDKPQIELEVQPEKITPGEEFEVRVWYYHKKNKDGGIHLHWDSTKAILQGETKGQCPGGKFHKENFQGNEIVECGTKGKSMENGESATYTLLPILDSGQSLTINYRAWDWKQDEQCNGRTDFSRNPESGTCSSNCKTFPDDLINCETKEKTLETK